MTELEQYNPDGQHPRRLVDWAREAQAAHEIAVRLTVTMFAPPAYRGKPVEGAAAILAGAEIGLSPLAALNAFDPIQGRPAPKAITLRAVAQAQGHQFRVVKSTDVECVIEARRRNEQEWQSFTWNVQRAAKLGLLNKENWQKQPQAMLLARCSAEASRFVAADALLGIPYAVEELDELEPTVTRRITRRRPEAQPSEEPEIDEPTAETPSIEAAGEEPTPEPEDTSGKITTQQQRLMSKLMRDRGINDHADRVQYVSDELGVPVETSSDLTVAQAGRIIDSLQPDQPPEPELPIDEPQEPKP